MEVVPLKLSDMLRLKMYLLKMFKLGQKEVTAKDFYGQKQITDISTIDVNNVMVSDKVSCNNGKGCRYIIGYQVNEALYTVVYQDA